MDVTLMLDEELVTRARRRAEAMGSTLEQALCDHVERLARGDDAERSIEEFQRLSGSGHSRGHRLNRDQLHDRS